MLFHIVDNKIEKLKNYPHWRFGVNTIVHLCDRRCACFAFARKLIKYADHVQSPNCFFFLLSSYRNRFGIEAAHDRHILYDLVLSINVQQFCESQWWFSFSILHGSQCHTVGEGSIFHSLDDRKAAVYRMCSFFFVWNCRNAVTAFRCIISHIRCEPTWSESRCHASTCRNQFE